MATRADVPAMVQLLELLFQQEADFVPERERQSRRLAGRYGGRSRSSIGRDGSQLLKPAVDAAWEMGGRRLSLLTDRDNVRTQQFYRRHGSRPSAMIPLRMLAGE